MVKINITIEYDFELGSEYTTIEVAQILDVSTRYIQRMINMGRIKYLHKATTRTGGHIFTGRNIRDYIVKYKIKY